MGILDLCKCMWQTEVDFSESSWERDVASHFIPIPYLGIENVKKITLLNWKFYRNKSLVFLKEVDS